MGEDKLVVSNGGPPGYDNCLYYNFTASEHPLLMFGNEVTAGQMAFGHTYVPWEWFGQLYFWYTVVGHFYYNFCDYDQAVGWVGPSWIGMERGQMEKDYDVEVAPLWRLMGKGRRVFGARIGPEVRQVEVRTPEGEKVVAVCSMNRVETSVRVVPQRVGAGKFRVAVTVDTARKHSDVHVFDVDMGLQPGFEIKRLPPYSIALFRFTPK